MTKSIQAWPAPDTLSDGSIAWNVVLAENPKDTTKPFATLARINEQRARFLADTINKEACWVSIN